MKDKETLILDNWTATAYCESSPYRAVPADIAIHFEQALRILGFDGKSYNEAIPWAKNNIDSCSLLKDLHFWQRECAKSDILVSQKISEIDKLQRKLEGTERNFREVKNTLRDLDLYIEGALL